MVILLLCSGSLYDALNLKSTTPTITTHTSSVSPAAAFTASRIPPNALSSLVPSPLPSAATNRTLGESTTGASVSGASVSGASVSGASVSGASVSGASVSGASVVGGSVSGLSVVSSGISVPRISAGTPVPSAIFFTSSKVEGLTLLLATVASYTPFSISRMKCARSRCASASSLDAAHPEIPWNSELAGEV